jgi:hypothetical protein
MHTHPNMMLEVSMKHITLCSLVAVALTGQSAWGGDKPAANGANSATANNSPMEALRQKIKLDKRFVVASNMDLSNAEAKGFWPVYDAYQKDLEKLNQRIARLTMTYLVAYEKAPISDDLSKKLLDESIEIENAELDLERSCLGKMKKVLPPHKVFRYAQIENKVRALVKYELAAEIPVSD